jgi:aspartate-semialdehyde dehydrogenase
LLKKKKAYVVAVVGATGAVGEEMIATLEQREFPVEKLRLFATERSAQWAPLAVRSGCVVIDNSSQWRMDRRCLSSSQK